ASGEVLAEDAAVAIRIDDGSVHLVVGTSSGAYFVRATFGSQGALQDVELAATNGRSWANLSTGEAVLISSDDSFEVGKSAGAATLDELFTVVPLLEPLDHHCSKCDDERESMIDA